MHQYKIIATRYSEEGALTAEQTVIYKDTAESAEQTFLLYKQMKQDSGMKAYKVELQVSAYKPIADAESFFAQFHI